MIGNIFTNYQRIRWILREMMNNYSFWQCLSQSFFCNKNMFRDVTSAIRTRMGRVSYFKIKTVFFALPSIPKIMPFSSWTSAKVAFFHLLDRSQRVGFSKSGLVMPVDKSNGESFYPTTFWTSSGCNSGFLSTSTLAQSFWYWVHSLSFLWSIPRLSLADGANGDFSFARGPFVATPSTRQFRKFYFHTYIIRISKGFVNG